MFQMNNLQCSRALPQQRVQHNISMLGLFHTLLIIYGIAVRSDMAVKSNITTQMEEHELLVKCHTFLLSDVEPRHCTVEV